MNDDPRYDPRTDADPDYGYGAHDPQTGGYLPDDPYAAYEGPPGPAPDDDYDEDAEPAEGATDWRRRYRGATSDPAFGYVLALALAVGLSPLIGAGQADLRYTASWGVLALFGVLAWLFGSSARITTERPENLVWGVSFGLILGVPLVAFGGSTLSAAVQLLFGNMGSGTVLAYAIFVIPLAETLFFRGLMQEQRPFWMIGLMGALWSIVLFGAHLDFIAFPFVALVICVVLAMMSMTYSYVRQRNGLAAAWATQIVVNLLVMFLPFAFQV